MIQRIQTLYLSIIFLIAASLIIGDCKISDGLGVTENGVSSGYIITFRQTTFDLIPEASNTNSALILALSICGLLALVSIFLYKKLTLQKKLVALNFISIILLLYLIFHYISSATKVVTPMYVENYSLCLILLILLPIFNYLAFRNIKKDIALLASADRLR